MIWRKIQIFVSSTFRDMDAERDVLKLNVKRRLDNKYRKYGLDFQFIDLRLGINTEGIPETEAENKVLDVCFESIERSRPFFIGLLGERYGWIPPKERLMYVAARMNQQQRLLIANGEGLSVTELEILFGVLGAKGENSSHAMFFFRDSSSYANMPPEMTSDFCDNESLRAKLASLKSHIWDSQSAIKAYKLNWNQKRYRFDGLEQFENLVYEQICKEIDAELSLLRPLSTLDNEILNNEYQIHFRTSDKKALSYLSSLLERIEKPLQVLLTGSNGAGKSTLLSQAYKTVSDDKAYFPLVAFAGSSYITSSISGILSLWICQMKAYLGESEVAFESMDYLQARAEFQKLAHAIASRGKKVIALLDNVDYFDTVDPDAVFLTWLNDEVAFLGTASKTIIERAQHYNRNLQPFDIASLSAPDKLIIISSLEERYNIALPQDVIAHFCNVEASPLRIALLIKLVANFTAVDISNIRSLDFGTEIEKINHYISEIVKKAPASDEDLAKYAIGVLSKQLNANVGEMLTYLSLSEIGFDGEMLELLFEDKMSRLSFLNVCYILSDLIAEDPTNHRWYFHNKEFARSLLPQNRAPYYERLFSLTTQLADSNLLKQEMLPYLGIKARANDQESLKLYGLSSDDKKFFARSLPFIIGDADFIDDMVAFCKNLSRAQTINLIYSLYLGFENVYFTPIACAIAEKALKDFSPEGLSVAEAHNLAQICLGIVQVIEYPQVVHPAIGRISRSAGFYLQQAISNFKHCYSLDPNYRDVRNMLKAAMIRDMDRVLQSGDWDEANKYFEMINQL